MTRHATSELALLITYVPHTIDELRRIMKVKRRVVEAGIQELRLRGVPVVTSTDGVWLARTADEAQQCAAALRRRLLQQAVTYRAMRMTARKMAAAEADD